jgi:4-carboxymuconolactone decarboxylase
MSVPPARTPARCHNTRTLTVRAPAMPDRIASGRAIYARNFRVDEAEAEQMLTGRVGADFTREVFEAAGGLGWQSTALTDRDRSIAIIAALVCQNVTDERLMTYLSLARRNGVDQQGLIALMVLLTAYVGQPYTSLAMQTVHRWPDLS